MKVSFDSEQGRNQVVIEDAKSRMSLDEAAELSADLARVVEANRPPAPEVGAV